MQVLPFTEKIVIYFFSLQFELIPTILFSAATFVRMKQHFSLLLNSSASFVTVAGLETTADYDR